ncbi:MAG: (2Fe-2S) ferredoxin domain-containing protein, partial [Candidatus Delongbacteria bacterium]|nr:(2Fe-2S) ferredoxin domain-containing protein [Candidatus Delongbacteria bacterium]
MKTIAELEAIRKKTLDEISMRTDDESIRVVIGMATCGIAAGARAVMTAF